MVLADGAHRVSILIGLEPVILKTKLIINETVTFYPLTIPPLRGGGAGVRGRGQAPTPHRPIPVARAARPARAEGPERQEAGGGALRGTHGLQRGPIGARKRRAGARSVTR